MMTARVAWLHVGLSLLFVFGLILSHLALVDIGHGSETDLTLEWWTLRLTFGLAAALAISSAAAASRVLVDRAQLR